MVSTCNQESSQLSGCCVGLDDIIGVNKPAGLAVHGGPGVGTDLSHYMHYWQYEEAQPPHLAHRLDMSAAVTCPYFINLYSPCMYIYIQGNIRSVATYKT